MAAVLYDRERLRERVGERIERPTHPEHEPEPEPEPYPYPCPRLTLTLTVTRTRALTLTPPPRRADGGASV